MAASLVEDQVRKKANAAASTGVRTHASLEAITAVLAKVRDEVSIELRAVQEAMKVAKKGHRVDRSKLDRLRVKRQLLIQLRDERMQERRRESGNAAKTAGQKRKRTQEDMVDDL